MSAGTKRMSAAPPQTCASTASSIVAAASLRVVLVGSDVCDDLFTIRQFQPSCKRYAQIFIGSVLPLVREFRRDYDGPLARFFPAARAFLHHLRVLDFPIRGFFELQGHRPDIPATRLGKINFVGFGQGVLASF